MAEEDQETSESSLESAESKFANIAKNAGIAQTLDSPQLFLMEALGGVRGIIEATLPALVFVVGFITTRNLVWPLVGALAVSIVSLLIRAFTRTAPLQAIGGLLGVGVGVAWAWWSGRGENYFAFSLWLNLAYFIAFAGSLAVRYPLIGLLMGFVREQGLRWRTDPGLRADKRAYVWVTLLWAGMFALRLAVKTPLYFAGNVGWLGTTHLLLGTPLFALVLWFSWLLLRATHHRREDV